MMELQENKELIDTAFKVLPKLFEVTGRIKDWVTDEVKTRDLLGQAAKEYGKRFIDRYNTLKIFWQREPALLTDIYVRVNILEKITSRLQLTPETIEKWHSEYKERISPGRIKEEGVDGLDLSNKKQYLMVLGQPGAGKTTFLKNIGIQSLRGEFKHPCIPVFISLKELTDSGKKVLDFMATEFDTCGVPEAEKYISYKLENGSFLLLLDGLDEVDKKHIKRICGEINTFCDKYSKNRFIITCRTAAHNWTFKRFTDVELTDFTPEQITNFVNKWFGEDEVTARACNKKLVENKPILELAKTPLLLTLLCISFDENMEFHSNRSELYKNSMEALLRKWDVTRRIEREKIYKHLSSDRKIGMLSRIACQSFEDEKYFLKQMDVEKQIADFIKNLPEAQIETLEPDSQAVLKAIEAHHGLLVERAHGVYSFSHLTFQEYFTARYVVDNSNKGTLHKLINSRLTNDKWREVFLLCAEMLPDASDFLKEMKQEADALIRDAALKHLLTWARDKTASVKVKYKPAAVRSFYISFAPALALKRDLALLDLALDRALALDVALFLALDHALFLALPRAFPRVLDRALVLARAQEMGLTTLVRDLEGLKRQLPQEGAPKDDWSDWAEKLRQVMIRERNIGHKFELNEEQENRLYDYIYANKLIVDCLNSQCYVSNEVREDILNNLLLPPGL